MALPYLKASLSLYKMRKRGLLFPKFCFFSSYPAGKLIYLKSDFLQTTLSFSFKFPADAAPDLAGIQIHVDSHKAQSKISEIAVWNKLAKV